MSPPGRAIDLGVVQEQSRMEMLKYQPGLAGAAPEEAGRAQLQGLVWTEERSVEPLSRDPGASPPPHPPSVLQSVSSGTCQSSGFI